MFEMMNPCSIEFLVRNLNHELHQIQRPKHLYDDLGVEDILLSTNHTDIGADTRVLPRIPIKLMEDGVISLTRRMISLNLLSVVKSKSKMC
jgi:hypothetical protein